MQAPMQQSHIWVETGTQVAHLAMGALRMQSRSTLPQLSAVSGLLYLQHHRHRLVAAV